MIQPKPFILQPVIKVFSFLSFGWGLIFSTFGTIGMATDPKNNDVGLIIFSLILIGLAPLVFGLVMLILIKKKQNEHIQTTKEQIIFMIAAKNNGSVTIPEISMKMTIPFEEAKNILETMVIKGIAYPEVDDEGGVFYKFSGLKK